MISCLMTTCFLSARFCCFFVRLRRSAGVASAGPEKASMFFSSALMLEPGQRLFVADLWLLDVDLVNNDLVAEDRAGVDLDIDLAEGKDVFALEAFGVADVEPCQGALAGENRQVDCVELDRGLGDLSGRTFRRRFGSLC